MLALRLRQNCDEIVAKVQFWGLLSPAEFSYDASGVTERNDQIATTGRAAQVHQDLGDLSETFGQMLRLLEPLETMAKRDSVCEALAREVEELLGGTEQLYM